MVARQRNDDDEAGSNVEDVRSRSDDHLAQQFDSSKYNPDIYGDFAHEFPGTHLRLTRGDLNATIRWPWPGNDAGLRVLLSHYRESGDPAPVWLLFKFVNDHHAQAGRATWTPRDFAMVMADVNDEADAREEELESRIVVLSAGRRKTQATFIVEKICATIHCSERRGYAVLREGTAILEQQVALAKAFNNDPARRLPRHWAKRNGGTWGLRSRYTFERYVLDRIDAFEGGDIGAALAVLIPRFEEGWPLPADDFESLLRAIRDQGLPISADAALDLWTRYDQWKRRRF